MKKASLFLTIVLLVTGCESNKKTGSDDLITINVMNTTSYPKKELILQDFMDVEYIALETNDDFINQGAVQAIGKDIILVKNYKDDGDIFVYDRTGKAIRKINRKGQGGEEYIQCRNIALDEELGEMFVNDNFTKRIQVYDLNGNHKRTLKHKEGGGTIFYLDMFNYDRENLLCYDELNEEIPFLIISKQDGSITKEIKIPYKEKKVLFEVLRDAENNRTLAAGPGDCRPIIPSYDGNWILSEPSSDTIYTLMPDYCLQPFMARTPSVQSMDPEVFLVLRLVSDPYYFMETIKKTYDFESQSGFPKTYFMYDTKEKAFFGYIMYNGDFSYKEEVYMVALSPVNHEIESWQRLEAFKLAGDYKRGQLKGKLNDISAALDEESNPVIMLVKHKK